MRRRRQHQSADESARFPGVRNVEHRKIRTEVESVIVSHFGDEHLDQNLWNAAVELVDDALDPILVFSGRGDEKRIRVLIGDDVYLPDKFGNTARICRVTGGAYSYSTVNAGH